MATLSCCHCHLEITAHNGTVGDWARQSGWSIVPTYGGNLRWLCVSCAPEGVRLATALAEYVGDGTVSVSGIIGAHARYSQQ